MKTKEDEVSNKYPCKRQMFWFSQKKFQVRQAFCKIVKVIYCNTPNRRSCMHAISAHVNRSRHVWRQACVIVCLLQPNLDCFN